jgi:hypothetical protein
MSIQREISFLNSLVDEDEAMPPSGGQCPEPTVLWSFTQTAYADSEMVGDLRRHVAGCRACEDLTRRFQALHDSEDGAVPTKGPAAWQAAEPRLNSWMRSYLKSQAKAGPRRQLLWSMPSLSWGIAFAAVAATIVFAVTLATRHPAGIQSDVHNQVAAAPGHGMSRQPTGPEQPGDNSVLMSGEKMGPESGRNEPQTLTFPAGEHLQLSLTSIAPLPGGEYAIEGKLTPEIQRGAIFDAASVSGIWNQDSAGAHLSLSIGEVVSGASSYSTSETEENSRLEVVTLEASTSTPQVGQTVPIEIVRAPLLQKIEP